MDILILLCIHVVLKLQVGVRYEIRWENNTTQERRVAPDEDTSLAYLFVCLFVFTVLKAYGTVGKYYMALGADNLPLKPTTTFPQMRILFSPEPKTLTNATSVWKQHNKSIELPGIAGGDIDEDGDIDLCITAFGADAETWLWHNDGTGRFTRAATLAKQGTSPCFGDVDNDGDLDLLLGRVGPDMYFQNDGKGNFEPVSISQL